jgi:CBS domain-containing protein
MTRFCLKEPPMRSLKRGRSGQQVMANDLHAMTVTPDADAMESLEKMQRTGSSRLLVTEGNRFVGLTTA